MHAKNDTFFLGIDVGASSCKAIVFDVDRKVMASAQLEYARSQPNPRWVELDATNWWNSVAHTIRQALVDSKVPSNAIRSIGISAETDGILAVAKDGRPLRPYIHWMDTRCVSEHQWVREYTDVDHIYEVTGIPLQGTYDFPALKMQWIKHNEPAKYDQTEKFLSIGTYILYKLTKRMVADPSTASRSLLFDVRKKEWSPAMSDLFGIPIAKQPTVSGSADVVGNVSKEASAETGLSTESLVVAGGGDTECSALGAGVIAETQALVSIGTSLMVAVPRKKPVVASKGAGGTLFSTGMVCTSHVVDGMWIQEVGTLGGAMLSWFSREFSQVENQTALSLGFSPYDILNLEAAKSKPSNDSPIFALPVRAIFNIKHEHTRSQLIRSILEGVAYQAMEVLEVVEDSDVKIGNITMVGGGAKSATWRQIMADVTNTPVTSPAVSETAAMGAGILAAIGAGLYRGFQHVPNTTKHEDNVPNPEAQPTYAALYKKYKRLCRALENQ